MDLAGQCPKCRYPLDPKIGLRCPECGSDASSETDLYVRRRGIWKYALAIAALLGGLVCATIVPEYVRHGSWGLVPNAVLMRWGLAHFGNGGEKEILRRFNGGELNQQDRTLLLAADRSELKDSGDFLRQQKAVGLCLAFIRNGDDRGWEIMREAMHHSSANVRMCAQLTFPMAGEPVPPWLIEELCHIIDSDPDRSVRIEAIMNVPPSGTPSAGSLVLPTVIRALRSDDLYVAYNAALYCTRMPIPGSELREALEKLAQDPSPRVRCLAERAMGHDSPELKRLLDLEDELERQKAPGP